MDYEIDGVHYHEKLPRILLVNYSNSTAKRLQTLGYSAKSCTLKEDGKAMRLHSPSAPAECDVLLVRNVPAPPYSFQGVVVTPHGEQTFSVFCGAIRRQGGAVVFLNGESPDSFMEHSGFDLQALRNVKVTFGTTATIRTAVEEFAPLADWVARRLGKGDICVGLQTTVGTGGELLSDSARVPFAFVSLPPGGAIILALPDFKNEVAVEELLGEILPDRIPKWFPFRNDLSWLQEQEFKHPEVLRLAGKVAEIEAAARNETAQLAAQVVRHEEGEKHLVSLLTTDGDELKRATKLALEELCRHAGAVDVHVLDVDQDPELRAGAVRLREDLRVEAGEEVFLVNVGGREQAVKQGSINQLDAHRRLFLKTYDGHERNVRSLLIANYAYAGGRDPRQRGPMFGSTQADAEERLRSVGHGAMGTYDLYRILRGIHHGAFTLGREDFLAILRTEGVFSFDVWMAARTSQRPKA